MIYYMDKQTGELLTRREMLEKAANDYDLFDNTNALSMEEYFEKVVI